MSEQAARYQRSAGGMVGAMIVLVVLVVAWVGVRAVLAPDEATPEQTVDYAKVVPGAREAADFDLVAPAALPAGWRATSVNFADGRAAHWHLGVLTDRDRYVGLEQGNDSVPSMVEKYVDADPVRGGAVDVAGQRWSTYTDSGGDLGLVHRQGRTTTVVVGHDVPRASLVSYAANLR